MTSKEVQVSTPCYGSTNDHTFFLSESGKLYSFDAGKYEQLRVKHLPNHSDHKPNPEQVDVGLG